MNVLSPGPTGSCWSGETRLGNGKVVVEGVGEVVEVDVGERGYHNLNSNPAKQISQLGQCKCFHKSQI